MYLYSVQLMTKGFAVVKDQGGNMRTAVDVLSNGLLDTPGLCCDALGIHHMHQADCYAHAINGSFLGCPTPVF